MDFFRKYLLPGLVFQSLVIAGGYGTGRELVEFFVVLGPRGGLLAILVSTIIWSAVCTATFEFGRVFRVSEYRAFFKRLLGPGWVLYEVAYLGLLFIVLGVVASAAGSILEELFGLDFRIGVAGILLTVGALVFLGSSAIERFLSFWSLLLYALYLAFFVACLWVFGDRIGTAFASHPVQGGWLLNGVAYAGYNLGIVPAALFAIRHITERREAIGAGLLAGPLAIIPGVLFYLAACAYYPGITEETLPANYLLGILGSRTFQIAFQVVLFGTLIETGTGFIHAVNERLAGAFAERGRRMPAAMRPAVSTLLLLAGFLLAQFGLVQLIARGYGTITWAMLVVYVIPVLTLGWWKIFRRESFSRVGATGAASDSSPGE